MKGEAVFRKNADSLLAAYLLKKAFYINETTTLHFGSKDESLLMAGPMNVDMAVEANTADTATALFDWALKFYDKNPIITSTCLLLLCAVPLATVILVFFFFIQKDRNRHIENKLKIQLKKAEANGSAE